MDLLWSESIPESLNVKDYYKYETLNDDEIRIIELEHGTSMDAVHCRLKRVRIADAIDTYEAISYAWGDPNDTAWITCSDAAIKVTNSLLGALKHLRYADRSRYLWADALCINQIDKPEKNNHVQRIGEVYSSAAKVLIWLGENTLEVGEALMNLRDFLRYPIPLFEWNDAQVQWTSQSSFSFRPDHLSEEAVEWLQYQQTAFAPTMQLMMLPWWRRKWVIQELVRAKHAVLISGRYSIEWASVQDALSKLQTPIGLAKLLTAYIRDVFDGKIGESIADLAEQGLNNAAQLADCVIKNTSEGDRLRLFDLMRLSRDFQCSDARDHLYSLLPIASDINQDRKDLLLVDYSASAATVSTRLSIYFLRTTHFDPLNHFHSVTGTRRQFPTRRVIERTAESDKLELAPSWACNYLHPPSDRPDLDIRLCVLQFDAGKGNDGRSVVLDISSDNHILSIKGFIVGEITKIEILTPLHTEKMYGWTEDDLIPWARKVWQLVKHADQHLPSLELFYDLVTCGGEKSNAAWEGWKNPSLESAQRWLDYVLSENSVKPDGRSMDSETFDFHLCMIHAHARRLCVMSTGHIGWVPPVAEVGDKICVFPGSQCLNVISPCGEGHYNLIGTCYIQGLMWGEAVDLGLKEEWAHLY